jgi:hypothetical protein
MIRITVLQKGQVLGLIIISLVGLFAFFSPRYLQAQQNQSYLCATEEHFTFYAEETAPSIHVVNDFGEWGIFEDDIPGNTWQYTFPVNAVNGIISGGGDFTLNGTYSGNQVDFTLLPIVNVSGPIIEPWTIHFTGNVVGDRIQGITTGKFVFDNWAQPVHSIQTWTWEGTFNIQMEPYNRNVNCGMPFDGMPPFATFDVSPKCLRVNKEITFDASRSYDSDGTIISYDWDWDNDGIYDETVTTPKTTHIYTTGYNGSVRLRVTDNDGLTAFSEQSISLSKACNESKGMPWLPLLLLDD